MGKAAIVNPYLDTLGGGERYTLAFAKVLMDAGWSVDLEWQNPSIKDALEKRFGFSLDKLNIKSDVKRGDGYDLCFWISDGSIPILRARKNILHFQVPFNHIGGNNLLNKMKFFKIDNIVCNSFFTKNIIDAEYGIESIVIYPPVPVDQIKPKRKENLILYVGRFSELKQSKRQDVLINTFKKFLDGTSDKWKLILAGGVEIGVGDYIQKLKKLSERYPVEIIESPDFKTLKDLYGKAKFFWSASGFGVDEEKNPEKLEHFGITSVEAMAAGCVPIVFNAGGQKEIIKEGKNGFLWNNEDELLANTQKIIKDNSLFRSISKEALAYAQNYSYEKFKLQVIKLL